MGFTREMIDSYLSISIYCLTPSQALSAGMYSSRFQDESLQVAHVAIISNLIGCCIAVGVTCEIIDSYLSISIYCLTPSQALSTGMYSSGLQDESLQVAHVAIISNLIGCCIAVGFTYEMIDSCLSISIYCLVPSQPLSAGMDSSGLQDESLQVAHVAIISNLIGCCIAVGFTCEMIDSSYQLSGLLTR